VSRTLLLRRGVAQARLLAAVLAVVVAGTVLLGTCALLLTTGADQARQAHLQDTPAADLAAGVLIGRVPPDALRATEAAEGVLADALAPFPAPVTTWTTSTMRDLGEEPDGRPRLGYLAGISDLPEQARLLTGRWPDAPGTTGAWEAVLPARAAELLGVGPGDQLVLTPRTGPRTAGLAVVLVGTFVPDDDPAWLADPLGGTGHVAELAPEVGTGEPEPAYGPFVVAAGALLGTDGGLDEVRVTAHPDLAGASAADLGAARGGLTDARAALTTALTGQDAVARVDAPLARTLAGVATQQGVTGSAVLVVALVGTLLAATALGLAARLVAARRAAETALLAARGAGRRQLAGQAAAEALALAVIATAVAVPLSLLAYRGLAALPRLTAAGLDAPGGPTWPLVSAVGAGALALGAVLVAPAVAPATGGAAVRRSRRGAVARSGADLVLAGVAVLAFLQLRAHPVTSATGIDPVLVAAPVLCLLAGAVLVLRLLPVLQAAAERAARRSRRLVVPLAAWEVARRPGATGAALLLVLATAAATFGAGYLSTWGTSQVEQASARVGTDVTVPAVRPALPGQGGTVAAATGGTVSPAASRPVGLGSVVLIGDRAVTPRLVAVDTSVAGDLLRGRPPAGDTWAARTGSLGSAAEPAEGAALVVPAAGPALTVTGSSATGVLTVRPVLVVRDALGARSILTGQEVPLDGRAHPVDLQDPTGVAPAVGARFTVIGVDLDVVLLDPAGLDLALPEPTEVTVQLELAGDPTAGLADDWTARGPLDESAGRVQVPAVGIAAADGGTALSARAEVRWTAPLVGRAHLLLTAYEPPGSVPVLLSADLADAIGAEPGREVLLQLGGSTVRGDVLGLLPYVPGAAGGPGVLADLEVLARALAATGDLDPLVDGWWAGGVDDPAAAAVALADAGLPGAVTRAGVAAQLRDGPLRAALPAALWLMVGAAVVLALAGSAVHTTAALESRAVEVARLLGLGVPRRSVTRAVLAGHVLVTAIAVLLGAVVGALACRLLTVPMTVSETGEVPVPPPLAQWPWAAGSLLVVGLLLGCSVVAAPVAAALVGRAGSAHLRLGDAP